MYKDIKEIRAIKGFEELTPVQRRLYLEFIHEVLSDEFVQTDHIELLRVQPSGEGLEVKILKHEDGKVQELSFESCSSAIFL